MFYCLEKKHKEPLSGVATTPSPLFPPYLRGLTNLGAFFRKYKRSETSARSQFKNDSNICLVTKHQHSVQKRSMPDDLFRMQNDLFVL